MKNKLKRKNLRIEDASFFFILFSFFFLSRDETKKEILKNFFFPFEKNLSFLSIFHSDWKLVVGLVSPKKKRENTDRDRNADKIGNSWR